MTAIGEAQDVPELETGEAPAPDPVKVAAVAASVNDLHAHLVARAAQHPHLVAEFKEVVGIVKALAARFEESGLGVSVVGSVSETEARLVAGLVARLTGGRDHLELGYLAELLDNFQLAVLRAL